MSKLVPKALELSELPKGQPELLQQFVRPLIRQEPELLQQSEQPLIQQQLKVLIFHPSVQLS